MIIGTASSTVTLPVATRPTITAVDRRGGLHQHGAEDADAQPGNRVGHAFEQTLLGVGTHDLDARFERRHADQEQIDEPADQQRTDRRRHRDARRGFGKVEGAMPGPETRRDDRSAGDIPFSAPEVSAEDVGQGREQTSSRCAGGRCGPSSRFARPCRRRARARRRSRCRSPAGVCARTPASPS